MFQTLRPCLVPEITKKRKNGKENIFFIFTFIIKNKKENKI